MGVDIGCKLFTLLRQERSGLSEITSRIGVRVNSGSIAKRHRRGVRQVRDDSRRCGGLKQAGYDRDTVRALVRRRKR